MKTSLILLIILGLTACGSNTEGYIIDAAVKDCASHGGVQKLIADAGSRHVRCGDGTYVQFLEKAKVIQHSEDNKQ